MEKATVRQLELTRATIVDSAAETSQEMAGPAGRRRSRGKSRRR